ncbi:Uncharacterised protein [Mycobacteroides abscessus subsp. abscessus]|nr:Uncharacterised protein [Mycobacteroides abscessus subsp. abscessus]
MITGFESSVEQRITETIGERVEFGETHDALALNQGRRVAERLSRSADEITDLQVLSNHRGASAEFCGRPIRYNSSASGVPWFHLTHSSSR